MWAGLRKRPYTAFIMVTDRLVMSMSENQMANTFTKALQTVPTEEAEELHLFKYKTMIRIVK